MMHKFKFTMTANCAIVICLLLSSAAWCQFMDEDYANVNCDFKWGGNVCDCENSKYVNTCSKTLRLQKNL